MAFKFLGAPYPIEATPKGYLPTISGLDTIKSDMLQLLLTYPGERCITGDTKISLADNTEVPIKELVGRKPFWVYSYDKESNSILPGLATAHETLKNAELLQVTLDNGEKIKCTSDHLWLLRDGNYCRTDELIAGSSLMPLYKNLNTSGYERIYQPYLKDYRETHLCFVEGKRLSGEREVVHHVDLDKRNNSPDNLKWMTCEDHVNLHKEINNAFMIKFKNDPIFKSNWLLKQKAGLKKYYETHDGHRKGVKLTKETKEKLSKRKKEFYKTEKGLQALEKMRQNALEQFENGHPNKGGTMSEEAKAKMRVPRPSIQGDGNPSKRPDVREKLRLAWEKRRQKNHKVVSIEKLEKREDCYDLSVEKYHNFALSAGVFVHNCMLPSFGTPLRDLIFEPNDVILEDRAREMIIASIKRWEPRVAVDAIEVTSKVDANFLSTDDDLNERDKVLGIRILFKDPQNITKVDELVLEVPLQQ